MATRYPLLSAEDVARNELGKDTLIFSDRHPLYVEVASNFYSKRQGIPQYNLDSRISEGLAGKVEKNVDYIPQSPLVSPIEDGSTPNLDEDHSISVHYAMPKSRHIHKSMLLRGVKLPPLALTQADIEATKGRARNSGRSYGRAPFQGGQNGRGRGRGRGDFNYAADSRPNPFAAHIMPGYGLPGGALHHSGNGLPQSRGGWGGVQPTNFAYQQDPRTFHGSNSSGNAPPRQNHGYGHPPGDYNGYRQSR